MSGHRRMPDRKVEVMVTFVISIPDERLADAQLTDLADKLDAMDHIWFLNRLTQKDGRNVLLRLDYKRPPKI